MDIKLKHTLTLIGDAKKGDRSALEEVCGRYLDRVHKIVSFRMGDRLRRKTESMDIVQSVMIKVIKDIDKFDTGSESRFINWLAKIIENTIRDNIDYYAAQKRRISLEVPTSREDDDGEPCTDEIPDRKSPTVTQKVDTRERLAILGEALAQLKDNQREVIILRNYAGMTFKEIAEVLDSTEDAVRMLFVRSMDKLTDLLVEKTGL